MATKTTPTSLFMLYLAVLPVLATTQTPVAASYSPAVTAFAKRQEACPGSTFQCNTSLGAVFSDICCANGQTCAYDENQQPACCPSGAVCTGTAPASPGNPTATAPVSYVPNPYFSFPYAATSFEDEGQCESAVSVCSQNYRVCTSGLGGDGGFAVTIDVPGGGGVTVDGTADNLGTSATSICSSLSSAACSNLQETNCEVFGSGSGHAVAAPWYGLGVALGIFAISSVTAP